MQTLKAGASAAEAYEKALVPGLIAPWAETIVSSAHIKEGMSVLDVACGTGIAARRAACRCGAGGRVVGVDIDRGMLSVARVVSEREGLSIEYGCSSACDLPFASDSFDAVLCLQGLQYFPDPLKAMRELCRVLRRESPLIVATWGEIHNCKGYWAIVSALERRNIDAAAARKPFSFSSATDIQSLAEESGFKEVEIRKEQRLSCFRSAASFVEAMLQGAPSTRLALEQVSLNDWPDFLADIESMLMTWNSGSGLEFPMESNVLQARR